MEYILIAAENPDFGFWLSLAVIFVGIPVAVGVAIYLIYKAIQMRKR